MKTEDAAHLRAGFGYGLAAYGLWGFLPIYFVALAPLGPVEIVAWRVVLSVVFCAALLTVTRGWRVLFGVAVQWRLLVTMAIAGSVIYFNWLSYIFATLTGNVVEAALGYFINPIVTIFLGVLVLRERLRPVQWLAVGISGVAVIVLAIGYGRLPWIALILALSFGCYGLIKKQVGSRVDAISGLTLETAWLTPIALVQLVIVAVTGNLGIGTVSEWHTVLVLLAGVITAVPLLLFAAGARRLPLSYMGFLQYFAPVIQLLVGVFILQEPMPPERLAGFALVWLALIVLTVDMLRHTRAGRQLQPTEPT